MAHTVTNLLVHFIFSTKQRLPLISPELENALHAYLGGIVRQIDGIALCIGGTSDHVHLLVRIPADQSVADVARLIKTNPSKWVHETHHREFAWQIGYGAFSVSESGSAAVREYIRRQKEHHNGRSFQKEFLTFVKKNGIVVDERYLWG